MKVKLAGYNLDADLINNLVKNRRLVPTPEVIAAAYARISRSQKSIEQLRSEARRELKKARQSNRTIVFSMGHHSIAEHAVFNFDITEISRLAVEEIEHHRLASFTERSQRYVQLENQFVVPAEIQNADFLGDYLNIIRLQNEAYHRLIERLKEHFANTKPELKDDPQRIENLAKEDARYITSLATQTQLGMTVNARTLELMLRRLAANELSEVRALAEELYHQAEMVAPSLLIFTGPTDYERNTYPRLREFARTFMTRPFPRRPRNLIAMSASDVTLVDYTQNADNKLLACLMHCASRASYMECFSRSEKQTLARKKEIFKLACQDLQAYDAVLREFEHLYLTFELVISAACFAQLKRHRLTTITVQPYDPDLGWTIPVSIAELKEHKSFKEVLAQTEEVYDKIAAVNPLVAQYVLTNAHQRRVLITLNARELYHLSRLRQDPSAQWDIRDIVGRMVEQARNVMPLTLLLAGGKEDYPRVYQELYGKPPRVTKLELPQEREINNSSKNSPKKAVRHNNEH
ncbi:MAG: FAD-dependent thymidylate synthase [candidate division WOR-3 bacterium]|jgi:flavin-dependent thymidylate synthase|nr:FAD-dependent thymidylate synthase [candidate division WOR-3 bacterium]MDH7518376.1 FAD-dependent thymidylate synthase [bacterium]